MANVFDVAKYILTSIGGSISTMKLQKLVYYSQAWHLVIYNKNPLFQEEIQAWDNGPVCRELFDLHKGKFDISFKDIPDSKLSGKLLTLKQKKVVDMIISSYGRRNGSWLSALSHEEDPWKRTYIPPKKGHKCEKEISHDSMYNYYFGLLKNGKTTKV